MIEATPADQPGRNPGQRREQPRTETDREIRAKARQLLIDRGEDAVTLRAIARELGITAPALYRYYASREDLIRYVCLDVCADLASDLSAELSQHPDALPGATFFEVCRGFRRWGITHPREFSLVFASPPPDEGRTDDAMYATTMEPFGRVFLGVAGHVLAAQGVHIPDRGPVPEEMREELHAFRDSFLGSLKYQGIAVPDEAIALGSMYFMLEFWTRLYGHVALEVFGRFPFQISNAEPLFESMLADLARQIGLAAPGTE
jgi:AcrR family transcriptional regulator